MTEQVELRWLRPDGTEAVAVVMQYRTAGEASAATAAALDAFEEVRREGAGSSLVISNSTLEDHHGT